MTVVITPSAMIVASKEGPLSRAGAPQATWVMFFVTIQSQLAII